MTLAYQIACCGSFAKKSMSDLRYKEELAKASEKKDDPLLKVTALLDEMLRFSQT